MDVSVFFNKLAEQGVLGIICGLSIVGMIMLYKEVRKLMQEQKDDYKSSTDKAWAALNAATDAQKANTTAMAQLKEIVDAAILKGRT